MGRILSTFLVFAISLPAFARDFKVVAQEFMPLAGSGSDGKMIGAHFEAAKAMCAKLKYNCTFEVMPLARALDMVKNGDAQMVLGVAKNAEREAFATFPPNISQVGYTFFVKKGEAGKFTKLEDFKGKTIAVHGGSATHKDLLEQNKKIGNSMKIIEEAVAETTMKKLAGDRYEAGTAAYCARAVCMYQASKENLAVEPVSFDAKMQSHSMPLSKKSVDAAEFETIKKALVEVMKSPEMKKIFAGNNLAISPEIL